jgi:predicted amidohydrolase
MNHKPNSLQITIAQIYVLDGDRSGNFVRIENTLHRAKGDQADIVCFPESCLLGWVNPDAHKRAYLIPGKDSDALCALAKKFRICLCVGLDEKDGEDLFDAVILIDDHGEILLKHRKMNLLPELMTPPYSPGNDIQIVPTRFGKIGLLVCADTFVDEYLQRMAELQPDLVLVPYGWAALEEEWPDHGISLRRTVAHAARMMRAPVVGTNCIGVISHGPWKGKVYGGQSVVADHLGRFLATLDDREKDIQTIKIKFKNP